MESVARPSPEGAASMANFEPVISLIPSLDGLDPAARLEHVDRFRNESAAAHVARFGLRIAVLDVALFVLELPDLDDEEVALADPHPLFQFARDPTESTLPVRTHHADPGCSKKLVGDAEDFGVFRTRHSDPYDLFFGHSRVDAEGRLKRLRVCGFAHSGRSTASGTRARSSMRVSPTGAYGQGTGGGSKTVGLTMSTPSGRAYF